MMSSGATVTYDKSIHPDPLIAAECEIERLQGLLFEARCGLIRAMEYKAGTPLAVAIRRDVRNALERTGGLGKP